MPQNTVMMRDNKGKAKLSFLLDFPKATESLCRVMEFGASKYAMNDWKSGGDVRGLEDSLLRHLHKYHNKEDLDEESGESHLGHALFNLMAIIESKNEDNR